MTDARRTLDCANDHHDACTATGCACRCHRIDAMLDDGWTCKGMGTPPGTRIRLIGTPDPYTRLRPGAEGTLVRVDGHGVVEVRWDDGSTLSLIPGEDDWEVISLPFEAGGGA